MKGKGKKILALTLVAMLIITMVYPNVSTQVRANDGQTDNHALSNPSKDNDGNTVWDCIYFGNYYQSDVQGKVKEPIKWRILKVDGNDAFLLADKGLDVKPWNETQVGVTWENSTMRSWLNGYGSDKNICSKDYSSDNFMDTAFSQDEQAAIKTTNVVNQHDPFENSPSGNDTVDQVYLLSHTESMITDYGFDSERYVSETRKLTITEYTNSKLDWETYSYAAPGWWLRSHGDDTYPDNWSYYGWYAAYVSSNGFVYCNGSKVDDTFMTVCPVLHLNIENTNLYSYAGTVSSSDPVQETTTPSVESTSETTSNEGITTQEVTTNGDTPSQITTTASGDITTQEMTTTVPSLLNLTACIADSAWHNNGGYSYYAGTWNNSTAQMGVDSTNQDHIQIQPLTSNFGDAWGLQISKKITGLAGGSKYTISMDMYSPSSDGSYRITGDSDETNRPLTIGTTTLSAQLVADGTGSIDFMVGLGNVGTSVVLDFSNVKVTDENGNVVYPKQVEETTTPVAETTVAETTSATAMTTTMTSETTEGDTTSESEETTTVVGDTTAVEATTPIAGETTALETTAVNTTTIAGETTITDRPAKPVGLVHAPAADGSLPYYFAWAASSDAVSYNFYVNGNLCGNSVTTNYNAVGEFAMSGEYTIGLTVVNSAGVESDMTTIAFTVQSGDETTATAAGETTTVTATTAAGETTTIDTTTAAGETMTVTATTVSGEITTVAPTTLAVETTTQNKTTAPATTIKVPSKAKIIKVKAKKIKSNKIKLSLKKIKGAKGYEIVIMQKKNAKKTLAKKTVKKCSVTIKFKNIKNKKKLFVKVRAYKLDGAGNKVFGRWSKVKKVKINKK